MGPREDLGRQRWLQILSLLPETVEADGRGNPEVSREKRSTLDDAFHKDSDPSEEVVYDFDDVGLEYLCANPFDVARCIAEFSTKLPVSDHEFVEGASYLKFPLDLLVIFLVVRQV